MKRVAIIDHGLCNLDSIRRAVEECEADAYVTDVADEVRAADRLVLPGVGAFADAMRRLRERGLNDAIREAVMSRQTPLLGICLGMQLLADAGDEGGVTPGLALVPGHVRRLQPTATERRIPHVGWNEVVPTREHQLFRGIDPGRDFYFVHSYHFEPLEAGDRLATTPYCGGFVSAVARGAVLGVQFHPEKSQKVGLQLLRNFLEF